MIARSAIRFLPVVLALGCAANGSGDSKVTESGVQRREIIEPELLEYLVEGFRRLPLSYAAIFDAFELEEVSIVLDVRDSLRSSISHINALAERRDELSPSQLAASSLDSDDSAYDYEIPPLGDFVTVAWAFEVSFVFSLCLEPLADREGWTELDFEIASLAAEFLALDANGVALNFRFGANDRNQIELEKAFTWLDQQKIDLSFLQAQIYSGPGFFGDGPISKHFVAIPIELSPLDNVIASKQLDEHIEIRLCHWSRNANPQVIQGFFDGELCWSRFVSTYPNETIWNVDFPSLVPVEPGIEGWSIGMKIDFIEAGHGKEARFEVGANGEPLFYSVDVRR